MADSKGTVLVVCPSLGIGGREKIALITVQVLENLGYHVIFVVFQRRNVEYSFQGEMINLNIPASSGTARKVLAQIKRSFQLYRLRKKYKACAVYSLGEAANITNVTSGLACSGKTIVSIHGSGEVKNGLLQRFVFSKADCVVCIAQDMKQALLSLYPGIKNATVIENGYELPRITQKEKPQMPFPHLVSMGRLTKVKGFDRLLKSMKTIRDAIPNTTLTLIGEGECESELKDLAIRLGLQEAVNFKGYLADPLPTLQENDIYVLASLEEGFPNALIEALHCGLPVIAADCRTGPREILSAEYKPAPVQGIKFEKYGVLVKDSSEGFEDRFAQAVLQLWNDRAAMKYYHEHGPDRAGVFSKERYQERLKKLLDD